MRATTIEPVVRDLPLVCDVGSYLTHRVDAQISGYYRPAARRMATRGARIRWLTVALSGTAAALTAVVGVVGGSALTAWIGVVTTVTTALTGYGAAQRYEYQQLEFTRTANQLERLRTGRLGERSQLDDDAFVSECERIISISNEGWMAKVADENPT